MSSLIRPLSGVALLSSFAACVSQAQAVGAPDLAKGSSADTLIILAQVFPTTTQRPLPGAAPAVGPSQTGTGMTPQSASGLPGTASAPGGVVNQGGVNQGVVTQGGMSQGASNQAGINQAVPNQGRPAPSSGNQSSGNQSGGGQASGAPPGPGQAAPASASQPAHPPATPAAAAPVTPPAPAQPQSLGQSAGGGSGGSAVVVVPQGAKRITPQVILQSPHKSTRGRHQTSKARHATQSRTVRATGEDSSGAGQ